VQRQPQPYVWAVRDDGVLCVMLYNPSEEARGWFTVTHNHYGADEPNYAGRVNAENPFSGEFGDKVVSITVLRGVGEDDVYVMTERVVGGPAVPDGSSDRIYS